MTSAQKNLLAILLITSVAFANSGCASFGPKVGGMSAAEHEQAAREDKAAAREHADQYDQKAVRYVDLYPGERPGCDRAIPGSCSPHWSMAKNPTDAELSEAAAHLARARRHRAAAKSLRDAEAKACANVDPADRDMSPFRRRSDILAVMELGASGGDGPLGRAAGATVIFTAVPGLTPEVMDGIVVCQIARNAALGFDQTETSYCPLNVRGATAHARRVPRGIAVDITSTDPGAALEIVKRAMDLGPVAVATGGKR